MLALQIRINQTQEKIAPGTRADHWKSPGYQSFEIYLL